MIDVLERIDKMRLQRSWSEDKLSKKADIPQTTINTWYRKKQIPTLLTLNKLSKGFDITLSQLLAEENDPVELSKQDQEFLRLFHDLDPGKQQLVQNFLEALLPKD